jgi:hypothetical protein
MKNIAKWVYLIGLLVAVVVALVGFENEWLGLLLILAGIFAGLFFFDPGDVVNLGIRYLVLGAVYAAVDAIPAVGEYLTSIFAAAFAFLGPVVLTVLVMFFVQKYFLGGGGKKR